MYALRLGAPWCGEKKGNVGGFSQRIVSPLSKIRRQTETQRQSTLLQKRIKISLMIITKYQTLRACDFRCESLVARPIETVTASKLDVASVETTLKLLVLLIFVSLFWAKLVTVHQQNHYWGSTRKMASSPSARMLCAFIRALSLVYSFQNKDGYPLRAS